MTDPLQHQEDTGYRWSLDVGYDRVVIRGRITLHEFNAIFDMLKKEHWLVDMTAAAQLNATFVFIRAKSD